MYDRIKFLGLFIYGDEKIYWKQSLESSLKGQKCRIIKNKWNIIFVQKSDYNNITLSTIIWVIE